MLRLNGARRRRGSKSHPQSITENMINDRDRDREAVFRSSSVEGIGCHGNI